MLKKLAKIKYLPNNFEILQNGDYVICAISGKKIPLENYIYPITKEIGLELVDCLKMSKTSY